MKETSEKEISKKEDSEKEDGERSERMMNAVAAAPKIVLIAAALPPQLDGIGDYTAHLAAELARCANVTVLTGQKTPPAPIEGVTILPTFDVAQPGSLRQILPIVLRDRPDWMLLQYNPFSYGKWGLNPYLPHAIRQIKRRHPSLRLGLMVHEPFVPVQSAKQALMTTWQRWQLWHLGRSADVVFFSISSWAKFFASWFPGRPILHLPVGSNIPHVPIGRQEARARLGIADDTLVLGMFGTAHGGRLLDRVQSAAQVISRMGRPVVVLYMGPHGAAVRAAVGDVPLIADGPLPAVEVSRRFAAVDIALAPYTDGISTRRGALMAALQHGVAVAGTQGALTDDILCQQNGKAFLLSAVEAFGEFDANVVRLAENAELRRQIGQAAQHLYQQNFDWPCISSQIGAAMQKEVQADGHELC